LSAQIATTQWSQVLAARDGSETEARRALEGLCRTYWQPLYSFVRHRGSDPDEARDLTQAYFTALLEKDFLAEVDPAKGRFRSFLLVSLRNFLSHESDRARALKRGGGTPTLSLDTEAAEAGYTLRPTESLSPEQVFERRWAMTVLDRALERLRLQSTAAGNSALFEHLKQYLTGEEPQAPYREAAEALAMSEGAVATAVHRLRKQYGLCLRSEIAETVSDATEVDDELRHLLAVVRS
jgi:RNA polymerase sigma-70 factor (ECF subfamily)